VTVPAAAAAAFSALKRRQHRFVTFRVDGATFALHVDKAGAASASGADLLKALPATSARYAAHDHEYVTRDGRKTSKLFLILWTPSGAVGKDNMLYASQRRCLDAAFTGVEDAQCSSTAQVAKLLQLSALLPDEDEADWDCDA
jgi:cofilin